MHEWVASQVAPCPPPYAAYRIGRTMYETDSVPADWVHSAHTKHNKSTLSEYSEHSACNAAAAVHSVTADVLSTRILSNSNAMQADVTHMRCHVARSVASIVPVV